MATPSIARPMPTGSARERQLAPAHPTAVHEITAERLNAAYPKLAPTARRDGQASSNMASLAPRGIPSPRYGLVSPVGTRSVQR